MKNPLKKNRYLQSKIINLNFNMIKLLRIDHWFKQIFVLPGFLLAIIITNKFELIQLFYLLIYIFSVNLMASANYVLNEYLDADKDRHHPLKKIRFLSNKKISVKKITILYLFLSILAFSIPLFFENLIFALVLLIFQLSGIFYNIKPFRLKDLKYLDVISESINNPIRLLLGFTVISNEVLLIPTSLILTYWFAGAFLMNSKRLAEYRFLKKKSLIKKYRPSLSEYNQPGELESLSIMYSMLAISLFSIFIIKYKIEFILMVISLVFLFSYYFNLSLKDKSITQTTEKILKNKKLFFLVIINVFIFIVCYFFKFESIEFLIEPVLKFYQ